MTESWKKAIDEGLTVGVLLIDFRKAFDSINHDILKKKFLGCSVSGNMFDILCDYLHNRSQYVELNGTKSKHRVIKFGVPQGSLLGPRLFTMYINDLPEKITQGEAYLYADDSTFYYAGKNIEEVVDNLNMIGKQVNDWCQENQLTIHTGKSEVLIITNRDFVRPLRPVRIGSEIIKYVKTTSLLGIEVDNKLTWNTQVKKVIKSYSAKVGQLKRMAYLPIHVQEEIYFKTIIAAVAYGMTVWWTGSPALLKI